jgi:hypothetical protein
MPVQAAPKAAPQVSRLAELEQRRAALEAERRNLLNQVIPDWPLQGDHEGMPYRTRADAVKGELDKVTAEIQRLQTGPEHPVGAAEAAVGQQPSQAAGAPVARSLRDADPGAFSRTEGCALYAQARRADLKPISTLPGAVDLGAANYIKYYRDHVPDQIGQVPQGSKDLTQYLAPGYAVVWDRHSGLGGAGDRYGHIAIVEAVHQNSIEISQAGTGTRTSQTISLDEMIARRLYFIK